MVYRIKYYHHKRGPQFKTKMRANSHRFPISPIDWNNSLIKLRNAQLPSLASVYEPFVIHSVTCECCEKAPKGDDTCPVKNQQLVQHPRGRHSIYRKDG